MPLRSLEADPYIRRLKPRRVEQIWFRVLLTRGRVKSRREAI